MILKIVNADKTFVRTCERPNTFAKNYAQKSKLYIFYLEKLHLVFVCYIPYFKAFLDQIFFYETFLCFFIFISSIFVCHSHLIKFYLCKYILYKAIQVQRVHSLRSFITKFKKLFSYL